MGTPFPTSSRGDDEIRFSPRTRFSRIRGLQRWNVLCAFQVPARRDPARLCSFWFDALPHAGADLPGSVPASPLDLAARRVASPERSCYKILVISTADFRHVLGHFASGVTIVSTCDSETRPTGLTASAFSSVSLDPPLVLICVDHKSQSYPALLERGCFAINVLTNEQEHASRRFASS